LNSPCLRGRVQRVVPSTLDGGSHGKEEKSQKSSEEKEKEESVKKESQKEVVKEAREEESGQTEEGSQEGCGEAGSANDGSGGISAVLSGNARGKNCPESRSRLAVSYGFQALSGLRMNCGQSGERTPRAEPQTFGDLREIAPRLCCRET
jgi:hypothetical protein